MNPDVANRRMDELGPTIKRLDAAVADLERDVKNAEIDSIHRAILKDNLERAKDNLLRALSEHYLLSEPLRRGRRAA